MKMNKFILSLVSLSILILSGCSTTTVPVVQQPVKIVPPPIPPLVLNSVQWQVLNSNDIIALSKKIVSNKSNVVLFTLNGPNLKNLLLNLNNINAYIKEQQAILNMYENPTSLKSNVKSNIKSNVITPNTANLTATTTCPLK